MNKRSGYIDLTKGILIFLVVLAHFAVGLAKQHPAWGG